MKMALWPAQTTALWCRCCSVERNHAEQVNVILVEVGTEKCNICLLATGWHRNKIPCSLVDCIEVSEQPAASIFKSPI